MTDLHATITITNADAYRPIDEVMEAVLDDLRRVFGYEAIPPAEITLTISDGKRTMTETFTGADRWRTRTPNPTPRTSSPSRKATPPLRKHSGKAPAGATRPKPEKGP